jgi:lipid II:glycine glycyltransferase (peptidoglycan interpeptide bridge formation enzyme)
MVQRKKYSRYVADSKLLTAVQNDLPSDLKMRVFLGSHNNKAIGAIALSSIGDTAMPIISAITQESIDKKLYVSYLLHWKMIIWLKENGLKYLDLRGYSPKGYRGPSFFKEGLRGEDFRFMGTYEAIGSHASKIMVRFGEWIDLSLQNIRSFVNNLKLNIRGLFSKSFRQAV